jgi:hypothetical protein
MIAYRPLAAAALATAVLAAPLAAREPRDVDAFPRFQARQESNFERNAREFKPAYERQQRERTAEAMRDKTHDHRLRVGTDTSIGAGRSGVNVIRTY